MPPRSLPQPRPLPQPRVVARPIPEAPPSPTLGVIADTADLARELLDVLNREAAALTAMKLQAPTGYAEAKTRLIAAYTVKLEELREQPRGPEAEEAIAALRALNEAVLDAARRNAAMLQGAMDGNRRMIEIVVKAVERERAPATVGYGRLGNRATAPRFNDRAAPMMITRNL